MSTRYVQAEPTHPVRSSQLLSQSLFMLAVVCCCLAWSAGAWASPPSVPAGPYQHKSCISAVMNGTVLDAVCSNFFGMGQSDFHRKPTCA